MITRFGRIALGTPDRWLNAGLSDRFVLLLMRMRLTPLKRTIPGLQRFGVLGAAEAYGFAVEDMHQALSELQSAGALGVDLERRLIYAVGSCTDGPPTTPNAAAAMAAEWLELPAASPVTRIIAREIEAAAAGTPVVLHRWHVVAGRRDTSPVTDSDTAGNTNPDTSGDTDLETRAALNGTHPPTQSHLARVRGTGTDPVSDPSPASAAERPASEDAFEQFWAAYPKHVGKDAARREWDRRKPDLEAVLRAVETQRASVVWTTNRGRFIPNPAKWLADGRWKDDAAAYACAQAAPEATSDTISCESDSLWLRVLDAFGRAAPSAETWLRPCRLVLMRDCAYILTPDRNHSTWILKHYAAALRTTVERLGMAARIEITSDEPSIEVASDEEAA